ncbi:MAG: hypothetical protein GQF41_3842 [Candidatus Rifleibacterium amylolyticum]|nr:MAG: hypothetical protein GQF41_3842 [Candidatus Rifleibacterium amylolyticum]
MGGITDLTRCCDTVGRFQERNDDKTRLSAFYKINPKLAGNMR